MNEYRPYFSICIPAYNRAKFLPPLLDSIFSQSFTSYEIVICEDNSPEREEIKQIVNLYNSRNPGVIRYFENEENYGYDKNIRNLVTKSIGEYCFFMGNDDLMANDALVHSANGIKKHPNIGFVLKSYAWFDEKPEIINQEIHYFKEEKFFEAGIQAITVCFRRAGVISGLIIHRDASQAAETEVYDGTLYYQMHITASVLVSKNAVFIPEILVLSRNSEPPEFGNSKSEKGNFIPGVYTPQARLKMIKGAIGIAYDIEKKHRIPISKSIINDYANYFYPYIKDQLGLPLREYITLYIDFAKIGFSPYFMFHAYFVVCYILGPRNFDNLTRLIRRRLGRSPHFGITK